MYGCIRMYTYVHVHSQLLNVFDFELIAVTTSIRASSLCNDYPTTSISETFHLLKGVYDRSYREGDYNRLPDLWTSIWHKMYISCLKYLGSTNRPYTLAPKGEENASRVSICDYAMSKGQLEAANLHSEGLLLWQSDGSFPVDRSKTLQKAVLLLYDTRPTPPGPRVRSLVGPFDRLGCLNLI